VYITHENQLFIEKKLYFKLNLAFSGSWQCRLCHISLRADPKQASSWARGHPSHPTSPSCHLWVWARFAATSAGEQEVTSPLISKVR